MPLDRPSHRHRMSCCPMSARSRLRAATYRTASQWIPKSAHPSVGGRKSHRSCTGRASPRRPVASSSPASIPTLPQGAASGTGSSSACRRVSPSCRAAQARAADSLRERSTPETTTASAHTAEPRHQQATETIATSLRCTRSISRSSKSARMCHPRSSASISPSTCLPARSSARPSRSDHARARRLLGCRRWFDYGGLGYIS